MIVREEEILEYYNPENKWVKLYFDKVLFPDGTRGRYNRIVEGDGHGSVALIVLSERNELGLVNIYRYPVDAWLWEVPRGMCELECSVLENARRELNEETGYDSENIKEIGRFFPNSAIISVDVAVLVARDLVPIDDTLDADSGTIIETRFFDYSQIQHMIFNGEIRDGLTLAAINMARVHGVLNF